LIAGWQNRSRSKANWNSQLGSSKYGTTMPPALYAPVHHHFSLAQTPK
jgi:hypothetical protein